MASVFEEIGGAASVAAAVDGLYDRILADDALAHWFTDVDMAKQKRHMRAFMAAALGGADIYGGRHMGAAHRGLGITHDAFDRVVGHLVATLDALGVPAATIAAIGAKLAPLRDQVVEQEAAAA